MKSRFIVVTGSCGGIGSVIKKGFEANGDVVFGVDKMDSYKMPMNEYCGDDNNIKADITNSKDRDRIIKYIFDGTDKIDALVNCVGVTRKSWDEIIEINLSAIYRFTHLIVYNSVIKHAEKEERNMSIVNITSLGSFLGFPDNPQYVASKGGLRFLTKALARDWGKYGIRVNNVCPGYIRHGMTEGSFNDPSEKQKRLDRMIIKRWGEPEEVFNAVFFLCSDASSYITGIDLPVDGGYLANGL